jgi:predicted RNA-binding protein (virulence factor B family)
MSTLIAGTMIELEVARKVDYGYFLTNGEEDVLLHKTELKTEETLLEGEAIEVFLYHDHENRLCATMHQPVIVYGEAAWLRVIDIQPELGLFLDQEIRRDLLLPKSELPFDEEEWPRLGDQVFVELTHDLQGRMLARLSKSDILLQDYTHGTEELKNQTLVGTVYNQYSDGAFLITGEGHIIFLPRSEMNSKVRLGQELAVRITFVREDGRLNATTKPLKQKALLDDGEKIVAYLQEEGGSMPYGDKTPPETIIDKFGISKAAFKRALGRLMKENIIYQEEGRTFLKEKK